MEEKRTSVFENGLIWFGAAVSIAEILTGFILLCMLGCEFFVNYRISLRKAEKEG